jgi:hypothetical protein
MQSCPAQWPTDSRSCASRGGPKPPAAPLVSLGALHDLHATCQRLGLVHFAYSHESNGSSSCVNVVESSAIAPLPHRRATAQTRTPTAPPRPPLACCPLRWAIGALVRTHCCLYRRGNLIGASSCLRSPWLGLPTPFFSLSLEHWVPHVA